MKVILNYLWDSTPVPMGNHLKIVLVEDKVGAARLEALLQRTKIPHEVICVLTTEIEAHSFLVSPTHYDLVLLNPDWEKGRGFALLDALGLTTPVILYCKDEKYALTAFTYHCIDYLVHPISPKRLQVALKKYSAVVQSRKGSILSSSRISTVSFDPSQYKKRFLVRTDANLQLIGIGAILCFYSENGRSFLVAASGKQFAIDFTLERLEELLDPGQFFRINRKVTVNIDQICSIEDHFNHRLKITLKNKAPVALIVSRKRVKSFKQWLRGVA